ncbi:MAG: hypothetical protein ACLVL7_10805 [Anaerotruncus massiliensis (ex Togo et al. 2019)]
MTGLNDTDIRLTDAWELTRAADGDAPLCSGLDCLYQNIILEALTQPGDLFYDAAFGWGLYDFIQSEDGDLVRRDRAAARLGLKGGRSSCREHRGRGHFPTMSSASGAPSDLRTRRAPSSTSLSARLMWR